jgi:peptidoglycan hydrolase-like protein with peptidoglycan-binding domain
MAKRGVGLALIAGLGVAMLAAGGSGPSGSLPPPPPPPKPTGKDEEIPRPVLERIAIAVASNDPAKLRAEAKRLRAEGYTAQAKSLEALANEVEASTKIPTVPSPVPSTPPPSPTATPPRDLVRGMKGEDVRTWQKQLIRDGYGNIAADADFGQLTFAATVEWQWERELKDDGIVGKNTRAAIGTLPKRTRPAAAPPVVKPPAPAPVAVKPPAPPKPPAVVQQPPKPPATPKKPPASSTVPALLVGVTLRRTPDEPFDQRVVLWQDQLKRTGQRGNVKSDGRFGANTEKQTKAFQKAALLDQTGIADPITIATGYGAPAPALGPTPGTAPAPTLGVPPLNVDLSSWRSVLQKGNKGEDVRQLQQVLSRYGFEVKADGDFGALTHTAAVAWQTAYARLADGRTLVPDGKIGKMSRERIAELERPMSIVAGELDAVPVGVLVSRILPSFAELDQPVSSEVSELAQELVRNLEATAAGDEDRELVARFQAAHGLNATGSYGPGTAEALIALGIVPPKPRWWPSKKLWRAQYRYRVALREQAHRDPFRSDEWLSASAAF